MASPNQLLLAFLVSLSLFSANRFSPAAAASADAGTTNADFIKTSCESTRYPHLCYTSLSSHASEIGADPEILAQTALTVAVQSANSTAAALARMAAAQSLNFTHREAGAVRDCLEELRDSVAQIRNSMKEMRQLAGHLSAPEFAMKLSDVQTWVSAALTDEDTCSDGFSGKALDGSLKTAVRQLIRKVARLTSNALALINSFAAHHQ